MTSVVIFETPNGVREITTRSHEKYPCSLSPMPVKTEGYPGGLTSIGLYRHRESGGHQFQDSDEKISSDAPALSSSTSRLCEWLSSCPGGYLHG